MLVFFLLVFKSRTVVVFIYEFRNSMKSHLLVLGFGGIWPRKVRSSNLLFLIKGCFFSLYKILYKKNFHHLGSC